MRGNEERKAPTDVVGEGERRYLLNMKVRRQLEALEPLILDPVNGLKEEDWHVAPAGKWSVGQIVDHLATSLDLVAGAFESRADKQDMNRRSSPRQSLFRHLVLSAGKLPKGRKTPPQAAPDDRPDPELITAEFRMGVERTARLTEGWATERQVAVFVAHPVLGDLNLPEWVRFHYVHCRHHAHQLEVRLRWLAAR